MDYSVKTILKAASLAGISTVDVKFMVSLLDEAKFLIEREPVVYIPISIEKLFDDYCKASQFTPEQLKYKGRSRGVSYVRHSFSKTAYEMFPDVTLDYIGSFVGMKHDTVIYYLKQIDTVKEKRLVHERLKLKLNN